MRRLLTALLAAVVALACPVLLAPPASAHTGLDTAVPGPGQKVAPGTDVLALTFVAFVTEDDLRVTVTGQGGTAVAVGAPVLVDAITLCMSTAPLATGVHAVRYRVTARDGHPVSGRFLFEVVPHGTTVGVPESCRGAAVPPLASPGHGTTIAVAGSLLAVVVLAAASLLVRARRRGRAGTVSR